MGLDKRANILASKTKMADKIPATRHLAEAADLIPRGYCIGANARDGQGRVCGVNDRGAVAWSLGAQLKGGRRQTWHRLSGHSSIRSTNRISPTQGHRKMQQRLQPGVSP
jgi:hypothetical protein